MIADLKPYAEYKESGLPWLGQVPGHWATGPGFAAFREKQTKNTGLMEKTVLSLSYGRIVVKSPERLHGLVPESFETYQIVEPGDIIIRSTDLQNDWNSMRVGLVRDRGIITSAYLCFRTTGGLNPEFGYQMLHTFDLLKVFYGLGSGLRQNLDFGDFKRMLIFVPPPVEQAAIVRFLDWANGRLERAIRAKRKVIALLNEQKQAIIHLAVTGKMGSVKGEVGSVKDSASPFTLQTSPFKMKPSGIPWLGDIPKHWETIRSKWLFSPRKDLALPDDVQLSATQAYGVIPQAEFEEKVGRRVVKISMHLEKRRHVEKDDFVISMRSFQGGLERAWATGAIRSSYVVLRNRQAVDTDTDFFSYLFKSRRYIRALQATGDFIRDGQDLNFTNFCRVDLPLIPGNEQRAIAKSIADSTRGLDSGVSRLGHEIELLREYRTRLVADVVTGKLDVRSVRCEGGSLKEEIEETEEITEPAEGEGYDEDE